MKFVYYYQKEGSEPRYDETDKIISRQKVFELLKDLDRFAGSRLSSGEIIKVGAGCVWQEEA